MTTPALDRRTFLKTGAAAFAAACTPALWASPAPRPASALRLTLLHTNDVHSWLDPFDSGEFSGLGGASARSAFIRRMRAEHEHVLFLDSGDMFQGTPYFNYFEGEPELRAMSEMGCLAGTIGNHEFDAGIERLAEVTRAHASFPLLNSNYDFTDTPMAGVARDWMVHEVDGLRIGLFGLGIKLEGLVLKSTYGETRYRDPLADARRVARFLRLEQACDFIICLSHISLGRRRSADDEPRDLDIITGVPEIDVVLGGHNHTLMQEPRVVMRGDSPGWVLQSGWAGTHIGVLQVDVYGAGRRQLARAATSPVGQSPLAPA
jgi:5'-nucleotidase